MLPWSRAAIRSRLVKSFASRLLDVKCTRRRGLNGHGLPVIIPSFHRRMIMKRDDKADILIQFYLSVSTRNRVIPYAPKGRSEDVCINGQLI